MNKNFHEWYLEVCPIPEEGQIEKRIKCVTEFAESADVEDIEILLKLYYKLPVESERLDGFVELFSQKDPSFSRKNKEEIALLAGVVLLEIMENREMYDIGELLVLSSSFCHVSVPFPAILDAVKRMFDEDRRSLREGVEKHRAPVLSKSELPAFKAYIDETGWDKDAPEKLLQVLDSVQNNIQTLANQTASWEEKESIYKEDSQLLWWMLSEWSNSLACPLKDLGKVEGSLIIGYEAAQFVVNYPGPYAMEGILEKLVSLCQGTEEKILFPNCVMQAHSTLREKILRDVKNSPLQEYLPLCNGIIHSNNAEKVEEWYPKFQREFLIIENPGFTPYQYAQQMYLEALALRCYKNYCK